MFRIDEQQDRSCWGLHPAPNADQFLSQLELVGLQLSPFCEQGEDRSFADFKVKEYRKNKKMAVAEILERNKWKEAGVRYGMRKSGLSQKAVSAILSGEPVRLATLATFSRAMKT